MAKNSKFNPFWDSVFKYSDGVIEIRKIERNQDILNQCIWYNSKIGTKSIFYPDWFNRASSYLVGDVLNEEGNLLHLQQINSKYHECYFLTIRFHYRITQRILGTQEFLYQIKQSDSDICRFCGQCCETIIHLFVGCNRVDSLWKNLQTWIEKKQVQHLTLVTETTFWAGHSLNILFGLSRFTIFKCAKHDKHLILSQLQKLIKSKYNEQEMLSNVNNGTDTFDRRWSLSSDIFAKI